VKPPEVKPPEVKSPAVKPPEVKPPEVKPPEVKSPAVKPPEVKPPEVKPSKTVATREKEEREKAERKRFDTELRQARALLAEKKVRAALSRVAAALKIREDPAAIELEKKAVALADRCKDATSRAQEALDSNDPVQALKLAKQALALVVDDPDAAALVKKAEAAVARQTLTGSVLVLVLYTKNKDRVTSSLGSRAMTAQVNQIVKEFGPTKLLGKNVYVLTTSGARPWAADLALARDSAFENRKFDEMFFAAFRAIAALTVRAKQKDFKTILVWETDWEPDVEHKMVPLPKDRALRLCYRFTDRDSDAEALHKWLRGRGAPTVTRFKKIDDLKESVEYFIDN
jgi:hypothetical protein